MVGQGRLQIISEGCCTIKHLPLLRKKVLFTFCIDLMWRVFIALSRVLDKHKEVMAKIYLGRFQNPLFHSLSLFLASKSHHSLLFPSFYGTSSIVIKLLFFIFFFQFQSLTKLLFMLCFSRYWKALLNIQQYVSWEGSWSWSHSEQYFSY